MLNAREEYTGFVSAGEESDVSKGLNQKREEKKKPAKTMDEKRAAKKAKQAERGASRGH
jgi:hypothetical protein